MEYGMIAFGLMLFSVAVIGGVFAYFYDRKVVKQGHCGLPWYHFDTDSQGGTGIKCQKCGETEWVSWYKKGIVDRKWT